MLLGGIPLVAAAIALGAFVAGRVARAEFQNAAQASLDRAARQIAGLAAEYVREREADLRLLAATPAVINAARRSAQEARRQGLDPLASDVLEQRFAGRSLLNDPETQRLLVDVAAAGDFAEVFFTDRTGLTALASQPTSDFVQADEAWWQTASQLGRFVGDPAFDQSAGTIAFEVVRRIDDPATQEPLGVVKGVVPVRRLALLVAGAAGTNAVAEVVDTGGAVLFSADTARLLRSRARTVDELVASAPTLGGRWRIEVREPASVALGAARRMEITVYLGAAAALLITIALVVWVTQWLNRQVTRPVTLAGRVAARVADGDLSVAVAAESAGSEEAARLMSAISSMVTALRRLVGQIRSSSEESAAMAEEISASTEEMSASTQEMATTCQNLSTAASEQATQVRQASRHAERILGIARELALGSRSAAERNAQLQETAERHRATLMQGSDELAQLAAELERGAADAEQLASLSQDIGKFVTQAQAIASQTNMLALNAAIEASRASGGEGRGFGVVADEVRKLAAQAQRAAASTAETVRIVLASVQATHERLVRVATASAAVRAVAEDAVTGLREVTDTAAETSAWADEISNASQDVQRLVEEITELLRTVSGGTESVVAAAQEIAASAEEQSASTEEIASSAAQLAEAAQRLTAAVSSFRLTGGGRGSAAA